MYAVGWHVIDKYNWTLQLAHQSVQYISEFFHRFYWIKCELSAFSLEYKDIINYTKKKRPVFMEYDNIIHHELKLVIEWFIFKTK